MLQAWNISSFSCPLSSGDQCCDDLYSPSQSALLTCHAVMSCPISFASLFVCSLSVMQFLKAAKSCVYFFFQKFKWIEDHLGAEWINRAIITRDKTMVYGDVLIDDKPSIQGMWLHPILFSQR